MATTDAQNDAVNGHQGREALTGVGSIDEKASGEKASGEKASGEKASGEKASGEKASGDASAS